MLGTLPLSARRFDQGQERQEMSSNISSVGCFQPQDSCSSNFPFDPQSWFHNKTPLVIKVKSLWEHRVRKHDSSLVHLSAFFFFLYFKGQISLLFVLFPTTKQAGSSPATTSPPATE